MDLHLFRIRIICGFKKVRPLLICSYSQYMSCDVIYCASSLTVDSMNVRYLSAAFSVCLVACICFCANKLCLFDKMFIIIWISVTCTQLC